MKRISITIVTILLMLTIATSCKKSSSQEMNTPRTSIPIEFTGTWYMGSSSITNVNYNGSWSVPVSEGRYYTFNANGSFEFGVQYATSSYGCQDVGVVYRRGTVVVKNGNEFTLYDNFARIMEKHSCTPASNYDKDYPLATEELILQQGVDSNTGLFGLYMRRPNSNWAFLQKK